MASYEAVTYNSPDGAIVGNSASEKVAFYGAVPVIQRPFVASLHNTTANASSADFDVAQLAILTEIQLTLIGLGVWATV